MLVAGRAMSGREHILQNAPVINQGDSADGISIIGCSRFLAWHSYWCAHQHTETYVQSVEKPTIGLLSQGRLWQVVCIVSAIVDLGRHSRQFAGAMHRPWVIFCQTASIIKDLIYANFVVVNRYRMDVCLIEKVFSFGSLHNRATVSIQADNFFPGR